MERPFQAYEGDDPFVFVCYAHEDKALVYAELSRLRAAGFNLWYDEGISPGSQWSDVLANHIERCAVFLYYVTPRAVVSEHCRREVNFALEQPCGMLAVHLTPTELPSGLKLTLSNRQAILKYDEPVTTYEAKVAQALHDAAHHDVQGSTTSTFRLGDWSFDVGTQRLFRGEESNVLDHKAVSVLLHLADRAPEVVSRRGLIERTWPDVVVGENVLDQAVAQLRRALGDDARDPKYIETLPRRGYRLIKPLEPSIRPPDGARNAQTVGTALDGSSVHERRGLLRRWTTAAVAAAVGVGIAAWFYGTREPSPLLDLSVAVLRLSEIGDEPAVATYAQALTEELRTILAEHGELKVFSATNVASARDVEDATYAIDGNVQRLDEDVRLRVSMTRTIDNRTVWSETFDRPWSEARSDPSEIARTVGGFVRLQIFKEQHCAHVRSLARNEQAATALCAAHAELLRDPQVGDANRWIGLKLAQRAVALAPEVAESHALLAQSYFLLGSLGLMDWREAARESHAALDRAFALASPDDPGLLTLRGQVQDLEMNFPAEEASYRQALANPRYGASDMLYYQLGLHAFTCGDIERALDYFQRAQRMFDSNAALHMHYAIALWSDGQFRAAIDTEDAGLGLLKAGPTRFYLFLLEGAAHQDLGELDEAKAAYEQAIESADPTMNAATAWALVRLGREEEAKALLARFEASDNPPVEQMVLGYEELDTARALKWIHEAIDRHNAPVVGSLRASRIHAKLRKDPRWAEVMAHLEAEEAKARSQIETDSLSGQF